jgi:hypothetical protein
VEVEKTGEAEESKKVLCPRCGGLGYLERRRRGGHGEHVYIYVVHREGKKVHKCYLGAEKYDYVERFHDIGLAGMHDEKRFWRYAEELVSKLTYEQLIKLEELIARAKLRKLKERELVTQATTALA